MLVTASFKVRTVGIPISNSLLLGEASVPHFFCFYLENIVTT